MPAPVTLSVCNFLLDQNLPWNEKCCSIMGAAKPAAKCNDGSKTTIHTDHVNNKENGTFIIGGSAKVGYIDTREFNNTGSLGCIGDCGSTHLVVLL